MSDTDGFCVVSGRKAKKVRQNVQHSVTINRTLHDDENVDLQSFEKRLHGCIQELNMSQFFSSSYDSIFSAISLQIQESTPSGSKELLTDTSGPKCLTSAGSEIVHQESLVPRVIKTDHSLIASLKAVSLSDDGQQGIHLLSYGIGKFITCLIARYQLAFLLAIRDKLGVRCTQCCVYDPVFSAQEKVLLEKYNCTVISDNEEGKRECTVPTVAFLPHCGKALYNNLLWKNLATNNSEGLSRLVLVGNSFLNILERTPKRVLNRTGNYILKLSPFITEVPLCNIFTPKEVFNDLSVHYFLRSQLMAAHQCLGENLEEPVYAHDDAEFIGKET